jgi:hypothetical protein
MTRLFPILFALPLLGLPAVSAPEAAQSPQAEGLSLWATCESNPLQVVLYSGPRGWQVEGDRQQLDVLGGKIRFTQGRNEAFGSGFDSQANPPALEEVLTRHLGANGQDHPFAAYDQAAWRQLAQDLPQDEEVMRIVLTRDGLILCSMEVPMGSPSSLEHAYAQNAARNLFDEMLALYHTMVATQSLTCYPYIDLNPEGWLLPEPHGCPGPITITPIPGFEIPHLEITSYPLPEDIDCFLPTLIED